jgi:hypothetical protein
MSGPTEAYPWNTQNGQYKLGTKMIICHKKKLLFWQRMTEASREVMLH